MAKKESHIHKFEKKTETHVPIRKYVKDEGRMIADTMTGKDILKQLKCECGKVLTYDLERKVV